MYDFTLVRRMVLGLSVMFLVLVAVYVGLIVSDHYPPFSTISGKSVSLRSYSSVEDELSSPYRNLTFIFDGESVDVDVDKFVRVDIRNAEPQLFNLVYRPIVTVSVDKDNLVDYLEEMQIDCTDAEIIIEDGNIGISRETIGRCYNSESLAEYVRDAYLSGEREIDCTSFMLLPVVTEDDLASELMEWVWTNEFRIEYTDGNILYGTDFYGRDADEVIDEFVDKLCESYETPHDSMTFTTSNGDAISVDFKTFGIWVSEEREKEYIMSLLEEPDIVLNRTPHTYGYDEFEGDYIEVSLEDQHVWHYVNNELCCEADCVTGTAGRHDTPTGVFYVSERIPGKYLRGDDYRTWVNRWMRLTNSGVGLHDAYWRGKFGGEIYKRNGSHGCINLPKKYAYNLFDEIKTGIPVVIY